MMIPTAAGRAGILASTALFLLALALCGCHAAEEKKPAKQTKAPPSKPKVEQSKEVPPAAKLGDKKEAPAEELEATEEKPRDLGQPLVDASAKLVRLDPKQPVWADSQNKHVVLLGEVCKAGYPLEFFATYSNRSYEAVVAVNVKPSIVHAGLLAVGAKPGHPAEFQPKFVPPTGTEVAIEVRWKDKKGQVKSSPAQEWIRNIKTKKALDCNWVFAGSSFVTDETTGQKYYQADSGELICVLSLPTAMLDLPILSYGAIESRMFEAFEEHLAPPGTPITILLKPLLDKNPVSAAKGAEGKVSDTKREEAEKSAIAAAELWLALVDREQYARSWETAALLLKGKIERLAFVKSLSKNRKPFGELKSRQLQSKEYTTSVPGAPDGQYVILKYTTSFANKGTAIETITPMLDKDKKWRISGYYIK